MNRTIFLALILFCSMNFLNCIEEPPVVKADNVQEIMEEAEWSEADAAWYLMEPELRAILTVSISAIIGAGYFAAIDCPMGLGAKVGFVLGLIPASVYPYRKIVRLMKAYHKIGRMKTITCK